MRIVHYTSVLLLLYSLMGFAYGKLMLAQLTFHSDSVWIFTAAFGAVGLFISRKQKTSEMSLRESLASVVLLLVFSSFVSRRFVFFNGSTFRAELIILSIIVAAALFRISRSRLKDEYFIWPVLILAQVFLTVVFLEHADGRLIFSDDHPSFLYRLGMLKEHFPKIPFYNLDWNGGYSAREFFPSGVLNVFFLVAPFLYAFSNFSDFADAQLYTFVIPYVYIFILPWSVFFAARIFGLERNASIFTAVLALGPSTGYFEWLLKYGTLGFSLSAGMCPLTAALSMKLAVSEEKPDWWLVPVLLVVSFFSLSWSLSVTTLIPLIVIAFLYVARLSERGRIEKVLVFALLFALCNGPWILTFIRESNVGSFVGGSALPGASAVKHVPSFAECLTEFRSYLQKINPAILLFGLPGLFAMKNKVSRTVLSSTIIWLLFVASVGEYLKPQLELRRMVIPASFFLCIPAGLLIHNSLVAALSALRAGLTNIRSVFAVASSSIIIAFFILSPINVATVLANRSDEHYRFANRDVSEFIEKVRSIEVEQGRIFFLGFILQEFGSSHYSAQDGGHLAPLPMFTNKEFYASDYYHRHWSQVDPIPKVYRDQGAPGVETFLDTVNASSVVTFTRIWADYCLGLENYEQLFQVGRFRYFRRRSAKLGYFLEGSGEIERLQEGFRVRPTSERSILKFRYLPALSTSPSKNVSIAPHFVFDEEAGIGKTKPVHFIELKVSPSILKDRPWINIGYHPEG